MKQIKKMGKALVFGLLASAALASCNGGTTGTGDVDTTLPEDDPTSVVTIKFWNCLGHAKSTVLDTIVDGFNKTYEGKYKLVSDKIAGDYDSLADQARTKLAAGEMPALIMGYPDNFSTYIGKTLSNSALLRLDNFINDTKFGYTKEELADFVPAFLDEGNDFQFEGTWSMPMYKSTEAMYYNASYFAGANKQTATKFEASAERKTAYATKLETANSEKATDEELASFKTWVKENGGYTYDVPETWEEMVATSRKMLADMKTEGVNDEFYPVGYDSDSNLMISQMAMRGIPYTTNDNINKPSDHIVFKNDQTKALVEEMTGLVNEKILITKGVLQGNYTNKYFTAVKSAMSIGSTGGSSYQVSSNFAVRLAAVPHPEGKEAKYIQQGPSIAFFNNGNSYIHKGAWLFYKYMADPLNNAKLALQNSYDPIRLSSFETDAYKNWVAQKDKGLNYAIPALTGTLRQNYMTSSVFLGSEKARTEIGNTLKYVVGSKMSVDAALQTAYNQTIKNTK